MAQRVIATTTIINRFVNLANGHCACPPRGTLYHMDDMATTPPPQFQIQKDGVTSCERGDKYSPQMPTPLVSASARRCFLAKSFYKAAQVCRLGKLNKPYETMSTPVSLPILAPQRCWFPVSMSHLKLHFHICCQRTQPMVAKPEFSLCSLGSCSISFSGCCIYESN